MNYKLENFHNVVTEDISLFICCASFESRCFTISSEISKSEAKPSSVLICYNSNEHESIIENANKIHRIFATNSKLVELNSNEPIENALKLNQELELSLSLGKVFNVFIDTTTFTHETLLILIRLLYFRKENFQKLFITYVGAKEYSINERNFADKWLSIGISDIRSVVGFPGVLSPARKYHLIILFGFESDRTEKLINDYNFDKVSIAFGSESISQSHKNLNFDRHKRLLNVFPFAESFKISVIDPKVAKYQILHQAHKYSSLFNTVIAPMNNKLSTVGCALAAIEDLKIQLIYAKPVKYNMSGYSSPKDDFYYYQLL